MLAGVNVIANQSECHWCLVVTSMKSRKIFMHHTTLLQLKISIRNDPPSCLMPLPGGTHDVTPFITHAGPWEDPESMCRHVEISRASSQIGLKVC